MLHLVVAFVAGAGTVLSFAPFGFFVLAIIGPAILFLCWQEVTPKRGFVLGFCFGLGLFGFGVSWVYVSLNVYGHMPAPLAGTTVVLFVVLLALFPAVVGWLQGLLRSSREMNLVFVIPILWTLSEWARSWFLTGFPWLSLGYSQIDSPLIGLAPWLGVYGVSWAVATIGGLFIVIVYQRWRPKRLLSVGALAAIITAGWFAGMWQWTQPIGLPIKVALVQGNIALHDKWSPVNRPRILNNFLTLSEQYQQQDLIVWPESAVPYVLTDLPPNFWNQLKNHSADFIFGIVETQHQSGVTKTYNSVVGFSEQRQLYRKQHLVPFGEFLPLKWALGWLIDYLNIPMADFDEWNTKQSTFKVAGVNVGVSICYEDAFPDDIREPLPDASILVNVSEDAWFGDSFAPHQRLDMARMRAWETGRPMLRAANTGISAIINHRGTVLQRSQQFVRTVVVGETQPMQGATPFVRYGSWPVVLLCVVVLLVTRFRNSVSLYPVSR